jgi:hypothetical protein
MAAAVCVPGASMAAEVMRGAGTEAERAMPAADMGFAGQAIMVVVIIAESEWAWVQQRSVRRQQEPTAITAAAATPIPMALGLARDSMGTGIRAFSSEVATWWSDLNVRIPSQ